MAAKSREAARKRERYKSDPVFRERIKNQNRRFLYGLDEKAVLQLLGEQGGGCAICGSPEPGGRGSWTVDHDHSCCPGVKTCGSCIRGVLCHGCNLMLGHAKDSSERLLAAARYLSAAGRPVLQGGISRYIPAR